MSVKPLVITMGEPAGIGGELTIQAWKQRHDRSFTPFFALDCPDRLRGLDLDMPIKVINTPEEVLSVFDEALPVLPLQLAEKPVLGQLNPKNSPAVIESIERAVTYCLNGEAGGVVTNPIHKAALYEAGFSHPGHTEFVGEICSQSCDKKITPIMMLVAKDLRVVPLTIHIPLKDVPQAVTADLLRHQCEIISKSLQTDFKITAPRIAIAGLNPHAGEDGKIGIEDRDVVEPAIKKMQDAGLNVTGPHPADTLFHEEARRKYDLAVGMYHDQVLIPLKTLDFHGGVNVTIGLPIVRTSPDHGTALDIAGKGIARADSLMNAIKMAEEMVNNRT
tara:strand:+ start:99 stop:1097 length:999 start_codon:yes stop_codon:yes gene_type:complete